MDCSHRPPCPGCPRFNTPAEQLPRLSELRAFAEAHGAILEPLLTGPDTHYRIRARLAVRGRVGNPKIGIFQESSHRIVDIPHCPVHHPSINEAAAALKQGMRRHGIVPYAEKPHQGLLRYMQAVVQRESGRVQLTLVVTDSQDAALPHLCDFLQTSLGTRLHSIWLNEHRSRGNQVLGPAFTHVCGPRFLQETILGEPISFHPGSFGQSNLDLAEEMIRAIATAIPDNKRILEFHCGVGAIGLPLLRRATSIVFNEISPYGLEGLQESLNQRPNDAAKTEIVQGPAPVAKDKIGAADIIICDPPRKGMEEELVQALSSATAEQLWLVYCGFESFLRDAAMLLKAGQLKLEALRGVHLFPHTDHLEVVARFVPSQD